MSFDPNPDQNRGPQDGAERLVYALFGLLIFGAFAAEIWSNFHPAKLSILLILVFWAPLLVLHELGHAVVAAWLGWRVDAIVIGFGRPISRFRWRGIDVEVRIAPIEGFVRCRPESLAGVRGRSAAIYAAGPGIELMLALALWSMIGPSLLEPSSDVGFIAIQSLALAAAMGAVLNLIPHSTLSVDGEVPNDGLGMMLSFTLPLEHFARMLESSEEPR